MRLIARAHYPAVNMEDGLVNFPLDEISFRCFFCEKYTSILKKDFEEGMVIKCKHCNKVICIITKVYRRLANKQKGRKKGKRRKVNKQQFLKKEVIKMKNIKIIRSIYFEQEVFERLLKVSERLKISRSQIVNAAVRRYLSSMDPSKVEAKGKED